MKKILDEKKINSDAQHSTGAYSAFFVSYNLKSYIALHSFNQIDENSPTINKGFASSEEGLGLEPRKNYSFCHLNHSVQYQPPPE